MRKLAYSVCGLFIVLFLFGCATTAEVERIVENSNKTIIQNIDRVEIATKVTGDIADGVPGTGWQPARGPRKTSG